MLDLFAANLLKLDDAAIPLRILEDAKKRAVQHLCLSNCISVISTAFDTDIRIPVLFVCHVPKTLRHFTSFYIIILFDDLSDPGIHGIIINGVSRNTR
jgi:hypothetical protein